MIAICHVRLSYNLKISQQYIKCFSLIFKNHKELYKHYKKVNKLGKVKCAFAAERYGPEKMEIFMSEICSK
jgi:hypothetical protein